MAATNARAATTGYEPKPRHGHALVHYKGCTYAVGGYFSRQSIINPAAVDVFDQTTLKWHCREATGEIPEKIYCTAYATINNHLYLFGGGLGNQRSDALWRLDLDKLKWTRINQRNTPSPRVDAAMVADGEERLVLVGGEVARGQFPCDLHIFSIKDGECCVNEGNCYVCGNVKVYIVCSIHEVYSSP